NGVFVVVGFFFSSRRRHTRWPRDWSSDVCSSDLDDELHLFHAERLTGDWQPHPRNPVKSDARSARPAGSLFVRDGALYRPAQVRSEERRVGKEWRTRRATEFRYKQAAVGECNR